MKKADDEIISNILIPIKMRKRHCFHILPDFIMSIIIVVEPIKDKADEHLKVTRILSTSVLESIFRIQTSPCVMNVVQQRMNNASIATVTEYLDLVRRSNEE